MGRAFVGISGWTYPAWRGTFYPPGLAHRRELEFASRRLNSIEVNGSFYALQRPQSFRSWRAATPPDFVFSVKGGRFITHMKRLTGIETPLANFFASGVLALGEKLGPLLWQLPPSFEYDRQRLEAFFRLLPRTTTAAAELAGRHDERMTDRAWTTTDAERPLRHALEVRHPSFVIPEFPHLLRDADVALVVADTAGKWPFLEHRTAADFRYVRLHGSQELYVSGYDEASLDRWAAKIGAWLAGDTDARTPQAQCDVFVYFDNDAKVRAPFDAQALAARLGVGPPDFALARDPAVPGGGQASD